MGGFFKKVAGAFVYLDEGGNKADSDSAKAQVADDEATELIRRAGQSATGSQTQIDIPPNPKPGQSSAMAMDADQVFTSSGVTDGPNSSQRLLKIIAGLAMFPREQQILMVRAMDSADETWSEKDVMSDARRRQSVLRSHLQAIDSERRTKLEALAAHVEKTQADQKRRLDDIDGQIAELQKVRQEAVGTTASALAELEMERKQTEEGAEKARRGITASINALSDLITFFTGGEAKPAPKP